jgi:hypothetical protein
MTDTPDPIPPMAMKPKTHWWLVWLPVALAAWWLVGVTRGFGSPRGVIWLFLVLTVWNILRLWPGDHPKTHKRLRWLFWLAAPLAASLLLSPMVLPVDNPGQTQVRIVLQQVLLGIGVILPLALVPFMRRGKVVALLIGMLTALATLVLTSISILVLDPGS